MTCARDANPFHIPTRGRVSPLQIDWVELGATDAALKAALGRAEALLAAERAAEEGRGEAADAAAGGDEAAERADEATARQRALGRAAEAVSVRLRSVATLAGTIRGTAEEFAHRALALALEHRDSLQLAYYAVKALFAAYVTGGPAGGIAALAGESWWTACHSLGLVLGKLRVHTV